MTLQTKIQEASARNSELLHLLHDTESAVPDLAAQTRYVDDLEQQFAEATRKLRELGEKRKRELKEHESYRDSVMKRFAYKMGRKTEQFEARAAKEEREYFDALQEEHQAGVATKNLGVMLDDAKAVRADLEAAAATHARAQADLDNLYDAIFAGPSPGFPEEDEREAATDAAVRAYQESRARAEAEGQVVAILTRALQRLHGALLDMQDALQASRADLFGGGTFADMMERSALSSADAQVQQARAMVRQAQRVSPLVRNLPPVKISQGNLLGDVFFDNIFSDMAFHDKIKQSNFEVNRCAQALGDDVGAAKQRHRDVSRQADQKGAAVKEARFRLQKAREAAFAAAAAAPSQDGGPPPPSYTAAAGASSAAAAGGDWWE